ncbi:hypothetical protein LTR66_015142 [Elasticomyces elasticus]|nr:hypothetical protein LTR66_015142 [Elasticomyces elasticus]
MTTPPKCIAIVNGTGRQAASVIRTVASIGWSVKAQIYKPHPVVKDELNDFDTIELFEEALQDEETGEVNEQLIEQLFQDCDYAFINTFPAGDEVRLGKALANAAQRHGVEHYLYSVMPDHSVSNSAWPALPNWACKYTVEQYIRQLGIPATYIYTGIYNNNFTSLPYPLFCMEFQDDDTIEWRAPFHPETRLPWLDAEADTGPAVLQLLKSDLKKWRDRRLCLAFQNLTPLEVCDAFSRALHRRVNYVHEKHIRVSVPIPANYAAQLRGTEKLFGQFNAPYFPASLFEHLSISETHHDSSRSDTRPRLEGAMRTSTDSQSREGGSRKKLISEARKLWPGFRRIEDYAREAFPIEEENNGKTWMKDMKSISS